MNLTPFLFLFAGYLFIFLEFYLPGAVLGILGGLLVFTSLFLFVGEGYSIPITVLYIAASIVGVILLIKFAMWKIKSAKPTHSIYSADAQEGYVASSYDYTVIGKKGIVVTDLKPGGYIAIDGKKYQAISLTGYITKRAEVVVVGGQEESLLVRSTSDAFSDIQKAKQ